MYGLTEAEENAILNSTDSAVATAARKLKAVEQAGEFVPKSRLSEETKQAKEALKKLAAIEEAERKAEEERQKKAGEYEKLLEAEKAAHLKTQLERDAEKKDAEEYRKAHQAVVESVKKEMGDKWDDSFATLSLEALGKIIGQKIPVIGVVTVAGKPGEEKAPLEKQLEEAIKLGRPNAEIVALQRQIFEQQQKKK